MSRRFFNAVILVEKILVNCAGSVVVGIKDGGDFDNVGSTKRGEAFLEGLHSF